ncbi:MAG TPA: DUF998 domain-containing protein [Candidatus Bathyarchaeia archaeon]|nr:DUF998 domain-containing protein [Candidatus Bathyarchaeia archaeon]
MELFERKFAGALVFVGGAQFLVAMIIAEALYPGYSVSLNYISDLGVGPSAIIFNLSVSVFGLTIVAASFYIRRIFKNLLLSSLVALAGVGAIGVGLFPENVPPLHGIFSFVAFFFGAVSAIAAYMIQKSPIRYFSVLMGVMSLLALILFATRNDLGLGIGGMERMIAYPIILWAIGFGGYLMNHFN